LVYCIWFARVVLITHSCRGKAVRARITRTGFEHNRSTLRAQRGISVGLFWGLLPPGSSSHRCRGSHG